MPLFIDRHDDPNLTPELVAEAHSADVAIQEKHGVTYHTYWFDPDDGTVFCVAEGPSREAVETVHREAHGAMANTIVELNGFQALNSFMGAFPKHPVGTAYAEPAMRAIVFTDICGSVAQTHQLGDAGHMAVLNDHNTIVRRALQDHEGREVKHTGDGIMAAFPAVSAALACAATVQQEVARHNGQLAGGDGHELHVRIGINAGEPLSQDDDLFGTVVQLASRLCEHAGPDEVLVSNLVRELAAGKGFRFDDRGSRDCKGFDEPIRCWALDWRG